MKCLLHAICYPRSVLSEIRLLKTIFPIDSSGMTDWYRIHNLSSSNDCIEDMVFNFNEEDHNINLSIQDYLFQLNEFSMLDSIF